MAWGGENGWCSYKFVWGEKNRDTPIRGFFGPGLGSESAAKIARANLPGARVILPSRSDLQKILAKFSTARIWLSSGETLGCPFPKHFPSLVAETDDQMGSIFVWKNRKICRKTLESGKKGSPVPECSSRDFKKFVWCHTKKIFFCMAPHTNLAGHHRNFFDRSEKGYDGFSPEPVSAYYRQGYDRQPNPI
jgi:hypothetical protein